MSILINDSPSKEFNLKKGLRQRCPLSLFLFNIVGEALNVIMQKATALSVFRGLKIANGGRMVSHLQFAGNTIIFC